MAASYCLPRSLVTKFTEATKPGGSLDPYELQDLAPDSRRLALERVLGDADHAKEVNAAFEEKLLLRYKDGFQQWREKLVAPEAIKETIADQINKLDSRILDPKTSGDIYKDLAEKKLGFQVNKAEAKQIFTAASDVKQAKAAWDVTLRTDVTAKDYFNLLRGKYSKAGKGLTADEVQTQYNTVQARNDYGQSLQNLNDVMTQVRGDQSLVNKIMNLSTVAKTLETGIGHFSGFGVQLWGSWTQPATYSGFIEQLKYFKDEKNYQQLQNYIISHPYYDLAVKSRLGLTDLKGLTSKREEEIQSKILQDGMDWVAKKTGLPINILAASSRAFTGYLNYVRFDTFTRYVDAIKRVNPDDVYGESPVVQQAAAVVNTLSGRANLGSAKIDAVAGPLLNTVLFTARKTMADINMSNPFWYGNILLKAYKTGNWEVAKRAIAPLMGQIAIVYGTLNLVHSLHPFGWDADINPISQSGGELVSPSGEKINISGSARTFVRLWARILEQKEIETDGKEVQLGGTGPYADNTLTLIGKEIRGRLGPNAGFLTDFALHTDAIGREFNIGTELKDKLAPIVMKNFIDYWNNNPQHALTDMPILTSLAGVPMSSPLPLGERNGLDAWGEDYNKSWFHDPSQNDLVDSEMKKIGLKAQFPGRSVNGNKLNDEQYTAYIKLAGTDAKQRLQTLMSGPGWDSTPTAMKQFQVKMIEQTSQIGAQATLHLGSLNTSNDLVQQSLDKVLNLK